MTCILIFLAIFLVATPAFGYYQFRSKIPNGEIVPHPCKANYMWSGVGHTNPDGGGERNVFGEHFQDAGYKWSEELCRMDSDGDGRTNGEELGDPDCDWTEGSVPKTVTGITHPGICDPYGQGVCSGKDAFVECTIETFGETCDVIKNADVQTVDLRFKQHEIPDTETNYYCQYFDLPSNGDYHVIADEGLIDNRDVVHHMLVYACPDSYKGSPTDDSPNPCSMSGEGESCSSLISLWTVGLPGTCFGDDIGFRIGLKGVKKVKVEIHYNNPMLVSGYTDTSGMRLYYQPEKPGVQDLATFAVGQTLLEIPPGKSDVEFTGSCPSDCTRGIVTQPMYVVSAVNHMHYMGRSQRTEVLRNGGVIKVLANDVIYDYDSPVLHQMEEPFEVLPGDEIRTTCTYSSMSKQRWVFQGDATSDEMCFSFLTLYPASAIPFTKWCSQHGPLSTCDLFSRAPKYGCDWARFANLSNPEMLEHYKKVEHSCSLTGVCRPECKEVVEEILKEPCFGKEMNSLITGFMEDYHEGAKFIGKLRSCSSSHDDDDHHDDGDHPDDDDHRDSHEVDCWKECGHMTHDCHDGDEDWEGASAAPLSAVPHVIVILMTSLFAVAMRLALI